MKLNDQTRFPHPVLDTNTNDYLSGDFSVTLKVSEIPFPAQVTLDYSVVLTEPTILAAIKSDLAQVGMFVTCPDAYFAELISLGLEPGQIAFKPGALIGRVTIRPMIWSRERLPNFSLTNCNEEFGGASMALPIASLLALGDEFVINVGREKLAQMETIFALSEATNLPNDKLELDLESDKITILAASNIYQRVNELRNVANGRAILLNGVYLPAVMEVLNNLRDGDVAAFEGKKWFRVFSAKCQHLGIDPGKNDIWQDAQTLLQMPFAEINKLENMGD